MRLTVTDRPNFIKAPDKETTFISENQHWDPSSTFLMITGVLAGLCLSQKCVCESVITNKLLSGYLFCLQSPESSSQSRRHWACAGTRFRWLSFTSLSCYISQPHSRTCSVALNTKQQQQEECVTYVCVFALIFHSIIMHQTQMLISKIVWKKHET